MKYLLTIIFISMVISSAYGNSCQFRQFVYGSPVAPADLNYNFNEINNCASGGSYKGCISWAPKELKSTQEAVSAFAYSLPILAGGKTLADLGDDAEIYISSTATTDIEVIAFDKNENPVTCSNIHLDSNTMETYSLNHLLTSVCTFNNDNIDSARWILFHSIPDSSIPLNIRVYACLKTNS